ncbi:hypothetical protein BpHYR1_043029 [Brachionus plicatilis]|uniref:Uncharacterized protein n=1 Tax=Brachionus plicatilis TaxID=10195 RepID=A0A3M7QLC1_BRAPC|nr:hypothetical protein BpHYR1_043029 [Brachionus plicatilis]
MGTLLENVTRLIEKFEIRSTRTTQKYRGFRDIENLNIQLMIYSTFFSKKGLTYSSLTFSQLIDMIMILNSLLSCQNGNNCFLINSLIDSKISKHLAIIRHFEECDYLTTEKKKYYIEIHTKCFYQYSINITKQISAVFIDEAAIRNRKMSLLHSLFTACYPEAIPFSAN